VRRLDGWWVPIYCANCGADGGLVPEYGLPADGKVWAFYLCNSCAEKWGEMASHTYVEPQHVFWQRVIDIQRQEYGHLLSAAELDREVATKHSAMALVSRELPSV
jgi:hypothetical protein